MYRKEENCQQEDKKATKMDMPNVLAKPPDAVRTQEESAAFRPPNSAAQLQAQMRILALHIRNAKEALDCCEQALQSTADAEASPGRTAKEDAPQPVSGPGTLSGLLIRMGCPRRYRPLVQALAWMAESLRRGLQNLYWRSQAMGSSFSHAIDSGIASLQALKCSLAIIFAPMVTALLPLLASIASAAAAAAAAIANFFSAAGMHAGAGEGYHWEVGAEAVKQCGQAGENDAERLLFRAANRELPGALQWAARLFRAGRK